MKKNPFYIFGCFLLFTGLIFAGCAATPQPPKAPEEMLKDAVKKFTGIDSHSFDLQVKGNLDAPKDQKTARVLFDFTLSGALDLKNVQDPHINLKFDGSLNSDGKDNAVTFEARLNKEAVYGKLNEIVFADDIPFVKSLKDGQASWWRLPIPPGLLKEIASNMPQKGDDKLTPDQKKMKELFENTSFFKDLKYVGADDVKGEQSFHYTFNADKAGLKDLLKKVADLEAKTFGSDQEKELDSLLQQINANGSLWIGKESGILSQLHVDMQFAASEKAPGGTVSFRISSWNFNKPVAVEVPKEAKVVPTEALLGFILGGLKSDKALQEPVPPSSQEVVPQGTSE